MMAAVGIAIRTVRDLAASEVVRVLTGQRPLSPVNAVQVANTRRAAGLRLTRAPVALGVQIEITCGG